ncbi:MAG: hypothetical protein ACRDIY_18720 [Chloroflexota bacterium]
MGPTYNEQMQRLVEDYRLSSQPWPAAARAIARWAIDNKRWSPRLSDYADRLAEDMARAMREEYIEDPSGRKVRAKHAARAGDAPRQIPLWDDIRTAPREHMQVAFRQQREQIVGDCYQLKIDVDYYNETRRPSVPIQLHLDFTRDVREREIEESF